MWKPYLAKPGETPYFRNNSTRQAPVIRILIAAGSISFLSAIPTAAQNTPFSDLDVFQVEYASDVQISPDGGWVVYVRTAMSIMRDRREGRLWMVRTDGTQHRQLTSSDQSQTLSPSPWHIATRH